MHLITAAFVLLLGLLGAGCSGSVGDQAVEASGKTLKPLETRVVDKVALGRVNVIAVAPLYVAAEVGIVPSERQMLEHELVRALDVRTSFDVLNVTDAERVARGLKLALKEQTPRQQAASLARRARAQATLYGMIGRYRAADDVHQRFTPDAAVQFRLWLVEPANGRTLWEAVYSDKSVPILEQNLLSVPARIDRKEVKVRSARVMTTEAFREAAVSLEKSRP